MCYLHRLAYWHLVTYHLDVRRRSDGCPVKIACIHIVKRTEPSICLNCRTQPLQAHSNSLFFSILGPCYWIWSLSGLIDVWIDLPLEICVIKLLVCPCALGGQQTFHIPWSVGRSVFDKTFSARTWSFPSPLDLGLLGLPWSLTLPWALRGFFSGWHLRMGLKVSSVNIM